MSNRPPLPLFLNCKHRPLQSLASGALSALVTLLALCLLGPMPAQAQPRAPEADLKAAILINMLMFIDWPTPDKLPAEQLVICYLDDTPVSEALSRAEGKSIKNRKLAVVKTGPDGLAACHAVYFSTVNRSQLPAIISKLEGAPVLLASDTPEFFQRGIMLNLELNAGHVVFDFDLRATKKSGLQISSKALRLARQIIE